MASKQLKDRERGAGEGGEGREPMEMVLVVVVGMRKTEKKEKGGFFHHRNAMAMGVAGDPPSVCVFVTHTCPEKGRVFLIIFLLASPHGRILGFSCNSIISPQDA